MSKWVLWTFSLWLLLSPLGYTQNRAVIVKNLDNELTRTAHRFGVSPEKIRQGRTYLRNTSELALGLAATEEVQQLGSYWLWLDRDASGEELARLVGELKRQASRTPDTQQHGQITRNARALADRLREVRPETAEQLLENWPEPPQLSAEELSRNTRQQRQFEDRRLTRLARENVDSALQELRQVETDGPLLTARAFAVSELQNRNRHEEADRLLDETLDLISELPPDRESLNALHVMISMYGRRGDPGRMEDLIELWAEVAKTVESPRASGYDLDGVEFSAQESYTLNTLRSLMQSSPDLALKALDHFPDLNQKLERLGGLGGYLRAQMQGSRARSGERASERSDLEREILDRVQSSRRVDSSNPDGQVKQMESTFRMLRELQDPEAEAMHFITLAMPYFALQGELTPELRRQGLEYVRLLREKEEEEERPADGETARPSAMGADRLEAAVYGIWLWSDPVEASLALEDLPEPARFRALNGYLKNLVQPRFRFWTP